VNFTHVKNGKGHSLHTHSDVAGLAKEQDVPTKKGSGFLKNKQGRKYRGSYKNAPKANKGHSGDLSQRIEEVSYQERKLET